MFWTAAIPSDSVHVHLGAGRASYHVHDLAMRDYGSIPNALHNGAFTPGTVSFAIEWFGRAPRIQIGDPTLPFTASVIENQAIMEWTATVGGVTFESDPANTSHSVFAEIGHERNGVFFSQGDGQGDNGGDNQQGGD